MRDLILAALGGNALVPAGAKGTILEQSAVLRRSLAGVAELVRRGHGVVITHGNGPQVGHILLRSEAARDRAYPLPLDVCVAQSQGETGYLIAQALESMGLAPVATLVTRVEVDPGDAAMSRPTKPVGPFMTAAEARLAGVAVAEDAGRGWRRVVPSPRPKRILEAGVVRSLLDRGITVVAAGGGGIPVRADGSGVEAVVDKDLASALLAIEIGAPRILDLTAVEFAYLGFGTPRQRPIRSMSSREARRHLEAGEFLPGSMGPKVEAAVEFIERGGVEVVITLPERAIDGLEGRTGTRIAR